jgi:hypothetical protein
VVGQVATTKELRELCQNGATLEDLRRLYGVNVTLEDLESVMPSPLIGDLGILPCSEEETKALSESEDVEEEEVWDLDEDAVEEVMDQDEDIAEDEVRLRQDARDDHQNAGKEEVRLRQDVGEEKRHPREEEKSREALLLLLSIDPQVPSYYDQLLALCLLSQSSNVLDILISLEILSRLM